ncbi:hypothetical protein QA601_13120 [Chitinispirillales bacterium ANBcel5]|uniref:YncE family protein n=1 Tax=Cellulosispirillum alkaliphilum TaxID=3039283 RepID=UPI002A572E7F|nr:hypothetical protein [Chitinispirillales bacterium ANBcel5]
MMLKGRYCLLFVTLIICTVLCIGCANNPVDSTQDRSSTDTDSPADSTQDSSSTDTDSPADSTQDSSNTDTDSPADSTQDSSNTDSDSPADSTRDSSNINPGVMFIMQSDFQSGIVRSMSLENETITPFELHVYSDAVLRSFNGKLYVLERMGADNILKLDPQTTGSASVVYQINLGRDWNPQDMVFLSEEKAYISNNNEPKITVFNPSIGEITKNIDISRYTFLPDSNTSPNAGDMELVGSNLYVLLQRRNGFNPGAPTLLLKIDTYTDEIVDTIPLQFKNGYSMAYSDGALYISNPGSAFSTGDGAVERVDLTTKEVTAIIDENALGGSPNFIVHKEGSRFYITNYVGWQNVQVLEIDMETGAIVSVLPDVIDAYGGVYYDKTTDLLYVGERDPQEMGIRIFRDNQQVGSTVKNNRCLPPSSFVVVR